MGSRLVRNTIFVSAVALVCICVLVFVMDGTSSKRTSTEVNETSTEDTGTSTTDADESGRNYKQVGDNLSAFLSDDSFFDKDTNEKSSISVQYGMSASLFMSSTQKDIRIYIVDVLGNLIKGTEFKVTIDGLGSYVDSDQDGIIYIDNLKAGDYKVRLEPIGGYKVPDKAAEITVKQDIEYVAMDDIDLLILSEEQVDPVKEDLQLKEADTDGDSTEITALRTDATGTKLGIDVSKWNKEIDWSMVKEAGVEFAIIRVGYRGSSTGSLIEDPYFLDNIKGATKAGIPVGIYFFTQATNEVEAVEEASMVISLVEGYKLDYPIFIDSESAGGNGRADNLDIAARSTVCDAFCETIKQAGYKSGIYGSRNWLNNKLDMGRLDYYTTWLAEYRDTPKYTGDYSLWQYTSKGSIPGIEGNVDLNLSFK